MKILAMWNKPSGVEYHRIIKPLQRMGMDYPELEISFIDQYLTKGLPRLEEYDLIIFNRFLYGYTYDVLEYMAKNKVPYIVDIDDLWTIPKLHPVYKWYKENNVEKLTIDCIKYANGVTTTGEELAKHIRAINPKVKIIPNALDTTDEQWNWPKVKSDKIRFAYMAGVTHANDAQIIGEAIQQIMDKHDNVEFWYLGYSDNIHSRSIYNRLNNGQKEFRVQAKYGMTPDNYGKFLSEVDCLLAPLENSKFNRCKSDIKVQEAKAYQIPIIASNVMPYSECDGVYLVDSDGWVNAMELVIENPNIGFGEPRSLEEMNAKRIEFYRWASSYIKDHS
jgi:glycosyltransferase involved in cell wall biosynthesis